MNTYCEHCDDTVAGLVDGYCGDCAIGWETGECCECGAGGWVNVWGECSECETEPHAIFSGGNT